MSPSYERSTGDLIKHHLEPWLGSRDLRSVSERDLLAFFERKLNEGFAVNTVRNALSVLRRVYFLAQREGRVDRNPATRIGELARRVGRRLAEETPEPTTWTRAEAAQLLALADRVENKLEVRLGPLVRFLLGTGVRRGEALALRWEDISFDAASVRIRRTLTHGRLGTPKSGKSRPVQLAPGLAATLKALLASRRREVLAKGSGELSPWVFSGANGQPLEANLGRAWARLQRRAQAVGVRALPLHSCRHFFATEALRAGRSVRWVAAQLGHSDPALTIRVYAHAMREEESDLRFADLSPVDAARSPADGTKTAPEAKAAWA
jgi:integrase